MKTYIALGANLDNPINQINTALKTLSQLMGCCLNKTSALYTTKAVGPAQPDIINAVIELETTLSPQQLLKALQQIEHAHRRERSIHWGPRTLDLDILLYEDLCIEETALIIPHPRMHLRNFVLIPLLEIAGNITIPKLGPIEPFIAHNNPEDYVIKIIAS